MAFYRGGADGRDKAKAIAAVLLVHALLGAAILAGLNVRSVERTIERLSTFDITPEAPPAPTPPPPQTEDSRAQDEEGAAGRQAVPSPVVAPEPQVDVPADPPVAAAPVPSTGSASSAGAASSGSGTGAGGSGSGLGGGGTGGGGVDYSRFTPARLLNKIPDREYRRISAGRLPSGRASLSLLVGPDGRVASCRVARSSGDPQVDSILCTAATAHLRFSPARDPNGRPVSQDVQYTPTWRPN